ncbi:MAG: S8 family serine peptidase [Gammaproteobacteria bacterium]
MNLSFCIFTHFFTGKSKGCLVIFCILLLAGCLGNGDSNNQEASIPGSGFYINGAIQLAGGILIDSDINGQQSKSIDNNSLDNAQLVNSLSTIGGYVNQPGYGPIGRTYDSGDRSDIYKVELTEPAHIVLDIYDTQNSDLDLFLVSDQGKYLGSSMNVDGSEVVSVTEPGSYYIEVFAHYGGSSYVLSKASYSAELVTQSLRLGGDFVVDEAIVQYQTAAASPATAVGVAEVPVSKEDYPVLVSFRDGRPPQQGNIAAGVMTLQSDLYPNTLITNPDLLEKWQTLAKIKSLKRRDDILSVEPDYLVNTNFIPNDTLFPSQNSLTNVNLPGAWDISMGDGNVVVAVVDTGILYSHPDLQINYLPGYDFIATTALSFDGDGLDSDPSDVPEVVSSSFQFHGTHITGIIAADTNNKLGIAGIAGNISVMPLRAVGPRGGRSYDVIQAVRYAAGLSNVSGQLPDKPADVINLSLGGSSYSESEQQTFQLVSGMGITIVASSGNSNTTSPEYPAAYDGVISVSATANDQSLANYANYGPSVDLVAPGGELNNKNGIFSTGGSVHSGSITTGYTYMSGTSMAAAHVTGIIALMKSVNPMLNSQSLLTLLTNGNLTLDLGAKGRDDIYGYGLIDAHKSLESVYSVPVPVAGIDSDIETLFFDNDTNIAFLTINKTGSADIFVQSINSNLPGLTISPDNIDETSGLGRYRVNLNRSGLEKKFYETALTFSSTENTLNIPVIIQNQEVATSEVPMDLIVRLIEKESGNEILTMARLGVDGRYHFGFSNIRQGEYNIIAGSDIDNDGQICGLADICAKIFDKMATNSRVAQSDENAMVANIVLKSALP